MLFRCSNLTPVYGRDGALTSYQAQFHQHTSDELGRGAATFVRTLTPTEALDVVTNPYREIAMTAGAAPANTGTAGTVSP
jgi:hypothetical protein